MSPPRAGGGLGRRARYRAAFAVAILLAIKVCAPFFVANTGNSAASAENHRRHLQATNFIEGNTTLGKKCAENQQVWRPDTGTWHRWNGTGWGKPLNEAGACCIPSVDVMKHSGLSRFNGQCGFLKSHHKCPDSPKGKKPKDGKCGTLRRGESEPCDNVGSAHLAGLFTLGETDSYLEMYYCVLGGGLWADFVLLFILSFMFVILGSTAEDFFCPALSGLSELLGLRPRVAGVTLLALGNGAPDVFSIIASVNANEAGMAVGEVTGAGNFVTTAVVGAVALVTPEGLKARGMFIRDILMLILATLCLFVVFKDGEVTRSESVAFLVLYVFYVVIVIAGDRVPPMLKSERPAWHAAREAKTDPSRQSSLHESLDEGREQSADYAERSRDDHNLMLPKIGEISMKVDRFSQRSVISARELASKGGASGALAAGVGSPRLREAWKSQAGAGAIGGGALGIDTGLNNFTPITRSKSQQFDPRKGWTKYMLRNKFQESVEWSEMGLSDKLLFAIEAPFLLARGVSIPAVVEDPDDPEWNSGFTRMQMVLNPPFALPYLVGGFADMLGLDEYITVYVNILLVLLGMGGMYLAFMLTEEKPHPILVKIYIVREERGHLCSSTLSVRGPNRATSIFLSLALTYLMNVCNTSSGVIRWWLSSTRYFGLESSQMIWLPSLQHLERSCNNTSIMVSLPLSALPFSSLLLPPNRLLLACLYVRLY